MATLVIASGAYLPAEMQSEFGQLPPAFLPLQNKRLYEHQLEEMRRAHDRIVLTLPEGFEPDPTDWRVFDEFAVQIHFSDPQATLGQALATLTEYLTIDSPQDETLTILLGDTLYIDAELSLDTLSASSAAPEYSWAHVIAKPNGSVGLSLGLQSNVHLAPAFTGLLCLASLHTFADCLRQSPDLIDAVNAYGERRKLAATEAGKWHDLGHIHTYFRARQSMTAVRHFNQIVPQARSVVKSSHRSNRVASESAWFENVPPSVRVFGPQYLGRVGDGYQIEYLHLSTLSDLYVFGRLKKPMWQEIIADIFDFTRALHAIQAPASAPPFGSYSRKLSDRLEEARRFGLPVDLPISVNGQDPTSMSEIGNRLGEELDKEPNELSMIHGDLCLSNVLYDFRTKGIRVIDPRGETLDGRQSVFGDPFYDFAKLDHSFNGGYDLITTGRFRLEQKGSHVDFELDWSGNRLGIARIFDEVFAATNFNSSLIRSRDRVKIMTITLFVSMLPLHAEDRTRVDALMANAVRLYNDWRAGS